MNNWEKLCKRVRYYTVGGHNADMKEEDFECHFREYLCDIFGWSKDEEETIWRQFPVYFGHEQQPKRADIVMLHNNQNTAKSPSIVIELKWKVGLEDNDARVQLFSYIKQLETEFGILTNGITLQLFYKPLGVKGDPKKVFSDSYNKENPLGVELGNLLDRNNYTEEKMRAFCDNLLKKNLAQKEDLYNPKSGIKNSLMEEQMNSKLDNHMLKMIDVYKAWLESSDDSYIKSQKEAAKWVRNNIFNNKNLSKLGIRNYRNLIKEIPSHLTNLKDGACRTLYKHSLSGESKKKFIRSIELINKTPPEECFGLVHILTTDEKYKIKGVGQSFWSEMLRCKFPNMSLVNTKTIDFFQMLGLYVGIGAEEQHKNVCYCYSRWAEMYGNRITMLELSHMEHFALATEEGRSFLQQEFNHASK